MATQRVQRIVQPRAGCEDAIGRGLWAMEETRQRTLRVVENVPLSVLDALPRDGANTLGALLYHIAAAEASWLFEDVLQQPFPRDVEALFPLDMRDEAGQLSALEGRSRDDYFERLRAVRLRLLETYEAMALVDFRTPRHVEGEHDVTPEWVVHHLMQHEAEHRGHMQVSIGELSSYRG